MASNLIELWVKVPSTNEWEPGRAEGLIKQLIHDVDYLSLYITARSDSIRWSLGVNARYQRSVEDTLYAFYPDIQIEAQPLDGNTVYSSLELAMGNLSMLPLMYATELKQLDPLAPMINAMAGLRSGEEIVYGLKLSYSRKNYRQELKQLTTPSIGKSIWEGLKTDVGGLFGIGPRMMSAEEMKQEQTLLGLIEEKLSHRLMEGAFTLNILASTQARAQSLIRTLTSNLSQFENQYNGFAPAEDKQAHKLVLNPSEIAALWHLPTKHCVTPGIAWVSDKISPPPPQPFRQNQAELVTYGVTPAFRGKETEIQLSYGDRTSHVNIVGRTGYGKTSLLHNLIHQDIANKQAVFVLDPQGGLVQKIIDYSIPAGREDDLVIFDTLDTDFPVGFNLITPQRGVDPGEIVDQSMAVVRKLFGDAWGYRMDEAMYFTLLALMDYPDATLRDVPLFLTNQTYRKRVLEHTQDQMTVRFWQDEFGQESASAKRDIIRPVNIRLRPLFRNSAMERIVCQQSTLDFRYWGFLHKATKNTISDF